MSKKLIVVAIVAGVVGAAATFVALNFGLLSTRPIPMGDQVELEKTILYWVAPMDPRFRSESPGKSPMGMDLIPVYEGADQDTEEDPSVVRIKPSVVNNIGVRTAPVLRGNLTRDVETVGYLDYDESKITHLHVRANGWIENLAVKSVGERVSRGQLLFEYYSPDLANAQSEYLQALKTGRDGLIQASGQRLRALGFADAQVKSLQETRRIQRLVQIRASQNGIVSELFVRGGMYVMPNMNVMTLADLSSVWLLADVFESQTRSVEVGQAAYMSLSYVPGRIWEGSVEYVYPTLDLEARTLKVRLKFNNQDEELKPNMYAKVSIAGTGVENILTVPLEALIRTGSSDRVVLALGEGRYRAVEVRAGIEGNGRIEIKDGVQDSDRVVVSSQFLIDSEASLTASIMRMSEPEQLVSVGVDTSMAIATTKAYVNSVMLDNNMINLTHDPIPAIGWPSMTMDFQVLDSVSLSEIDSGSSVEFSLQKDASGTFNITGISLAPPGNDVVQETVDEPEIWGEGIINSISDNREMVTLAHQPISDLGWPAMTMEFHLSASIDSSNLKSGQEIRFSLAKETDGAYEIVLVKTIDKDDVQ